MTAVRAAQPVIFGEVLFDHFPDGSSNLGGAPFNVACHLQGFGARPLLVSRVGEDPMGQRIRDTMEAWGMDLGGLQLDPVKPTGTVEVRIQGQQPSYDIVAERAYDEVDASALPPLGPTPLVYHGSLALRGANNCRTLQCLVAATRAPVYVDVNLRPPWWQRDQVLEMLSRATWAKLNEDELRTLAPGGDDMETQARAIQEAAGLELVIVTLGERGALARTRGGSVHRVVPLPATRFVDTVGAGDAFASVTLLGLLRGWPLDTILARAQALASAVVGIRGATPESRAFYKPFLADWS